MSTAYHTFYFHLANAQPISDDVLQDLGSAAWKLINKEMDAWADRLVTVKDHHMDFQVEALDLCEDDVCVEVLPGQDSVLTYGIGFYTEQQGLVLTQAHLSHVQALCLAAFRTVCANAGLPDVTVTMARVTVRESTDVWTDSAGSSLEQLLAVGDEFFWVTSNGDTPGALYTNREKAFAESNVYVDAFSKEGKPVRAYELKPFDEVRPATAADYTTDF